MNKLVRSFVEEFVKQGKSMIQDNSFYPGVIIIVDTPKEGMQPYHIKGSEDFFEKGINKKKTILSAVSSLMVLINSEIDRNIKLEAVVCISDVNFSIVKMPEPGLKSDEEVRKFADEYERKPGYVPPRLDPQSIEALCLCVNCRDKSYLFQYTYERQNGKVVFVPGEHDCDMYNAIGNLAEVFPDELK